MERDIETAVGGKQVAIHPVTLQAVPDESIVESGLLKTMRQLEGFPTSYQLKMAFEVHVLQQEIRDVRIEAPINQKNMTSYGILGNLVGAVLFNEAQCLLVKMQNDANNGEM